MPAHLDYVFATAFLVAVVVSFRAMEMLFRDRDAAALRLLPVSPLRRIAPAFRGAFVLCVSVLFPAGVVFGVASADAHVAASIAVFTLAAPVLITAFSVGASLAAGMVVADPASRWSTAMNAAARTSSGGAFHFGPFASLVACACGLLLLELGAAEPLRTATQTGGWVWLPAAKFAVALPLVCAAVAGVLIPSRARVHFTAMDVAFAEAERVRTPAQAERHGRIRGRVSDASDPYLSAVQMQRARVTSTGFAVTCLLSFVAAFWLARRDAAALAPLVGGLLVVWVVAVVDPARGLRARGPAPASPTDPWVFDTPRARAALRRAVRREVLGYAVVVGVAALWVARSVEGTSRVPVVLGIALPLWSSLLAYIATSGSSRGRRVLVSLAAALPALLGAAGALMFWQ